MFRSKTPTLVRDVYGRTAIIPSNCTFPLSSFHVLMSSRLSRKCSDDVGGDAVVPLLEDGVIVYDEESLLV